MSLGEEDEMRLKINELHGGEEIYIMIIMGDRIKVAT